MFKSASHIHQESAIKVTGSVHADERAEGGHELHVTSLEVVHASKEYPVTPKSHGSDFLFKHRHLWLRSRRPTAIMKIRHTTIDAIRRFFNDNGFTLVDTPIFAAVGRRRCPNAFRGRLLRRARLPRADRSALSRVGGARLRQGLLLRADLPRGKIQDPPPPHRVLDGRARDRLCRSR